MFVHNGLCLEHTGDGCDSLWALRSGGINGWEPVSHRQLRLPQPATYSCTLKIWIDVDRGSPAGRETALRKISQASGALLLAFHTSLPTDSRKVPEDLKLIVE